MRTAVVFLISICAYAGVPPGSVTASAVLVNGSYQVTATLQPAFTPPLLPAGLNLLRVDGAAPAILGVMHDDGLNGDAVAGDGIYTLLFTTASVAQLQLQSSAALQAQIHRVKSGPVTTIPVVVPTLQLVSPNSGQQGQKDLSVAITGKDTHFSQGTTTASFGAGINIVSLTVNSATSATAVLDVTADATAGLHDVTLTSGLEVIPLLGGFTVTSAFLTGDVFTWHYDTTRSGLNPNETVLTPANVTSAGFGKVAEFTVDGQIDGQVLYLHQVNMPAVGLKNVVYFATRNDSVYALDAASVTGSTATVLWKAALLPAGETAATALDCGGTNGITATPVIDRARNAIYVITMTQNTTSKAVFQRIHALDLTTGLELFGGPTTVAATYPGTGGNSHNGIVTFDPAHQHDRAALLETAGTIYTVWSGLNGDCGSYSPWVITYSADTLEQTAALDLAPDNYGGGMWMGGAGPSVDAAGNVYTITGNGFGGNPEGGLPTGSYNNSLVKLALNGGLLVADYFTPDITTVDNQRDLDFGSAGPLLLDLVDNASTTHHLAMSGGKDGQFYVVDRENMGAFSAATDNIYQQFTLSGGLNFSTPIYFNGAVYICPSGSSLKAFSISNAKLATPPTQSSNSFGSSGAVISASSNGTSDGIIWALDWTKTELFAYNAANVTTNIYNSTQAAGSRDHFSTVGGHFVTPTVVDGKVYFGTGSSVVVFGLLQ